MTENIGWGDPTTAAFWAAAERGELRLQRCEECERFQHFPRVFCLGCGGRSLTWTLVDGGGVVYSRTTNWLPVREDLEPPYSVCLVDLDAGARMMGSTEGEVAIGDRVRLVWRERRGAPPLPHFVKAQ